MTDPFNGKRFTVCMFLPMEIVTFSQRVKVVEVSKLVEIPSEVQVRQAISRLRHRRRKILKVGGAKYIIAREARAKISRPRLLWVKPRPFLCTI